MNGHQFSRPFLAFSLPFTALLLRVCFTAFQCLTTVRRFQSMLAKLESGEAVDQGAIMYDTAARTFAQFDFDGSGALSDLRRSHIQTPTNVLWGSGLRGR